VRLAATTVCARPEAAEREQPRGGANSGSGDRLRPVINDLGLTVQAHTAVGQPSHICPANSTAGVPGAIANRCGYPRTDGSLGDVIGLVALGALIEWLRSQFPGRRRDFEGSMIFLPIIVVIVGGFALMILYAIASTVAK